MYEYRIQKKVFKNFSYEIQGGKINAIIGMSGSGKTTIVNMIPGFMPKQR